VPEEENLSRKRCGFSTKATIGRSTRISNQVIYYRRRPGKRSSLAQSLNQASTGLSTPSLVRDNSASYNDTRGSLSVTKWVMMGVERETRRNCWISKVPNDYEV
jgi:hypothetical protein